MTADRDVPVINLDGGRATDSNAFDIDPAPVVSSLRPSSRGQGATSQTLVITGSGFGSGAWRRPRSPRSARMPALGLRDVTVTNPDAGWFTLNNGFTVQS